MVIKKTLAFLLSATYLTTSPVFSMDPSVHEGHKTSVPRQLTPDQEFKLRQQRELAQNEEIVEKLSRQFHERKDQGAFPEELIEIVGKIFSIHPVGSFHGSFPVWLEVLSDEKLKTLLASYRETLDVLINKSPRHDIILSNTQCINTEIEKRKLK